MKTFFKVFLFTFIPMTILLLLTWYYSNNLLLELAKKETLRDISSKWELLAMSEFPTTFNTKTHNFFKKTTEKTNLRITLISKTGRVIDDSYFDLNGITKLENHLYRPEVQNAIHYGKGYSIRFSKSTNQEMLYYAKTYKDGILRISYPLTYVNLLKQEFKKQNISNFAIMTLLLIFLTTYLARRISMPIQKLNYIAEQIEQGNKNIVFPRFKDKTMIKIASIIYRIYNSMNEKQKLIEQEQAKLNHIFKILHQGIILLDKNNNLKHWNSISEEYLNSKFNLNENIIKNISDVDSLVFVKELLEINENKIIQKILKNKTFEIDIHIMEQEKLFVFYDISERYEYENFKAELIGNITHELKTPLAMIMGYSETLLENDNLTKEQLNKFLQTIYKSSHNLNQLINDILELHKLESEGNQFQISEPIDTEDIILEIEQKYNNSDKNLKVNYKKNKIYIHYDHIISVIANLIDNAMKYSQGNNIYLTIEKNNNDIKIIIDDEGPVIQPSEKNRIFERFYTVHKSKNRNETGTGLGLSIVKHIATLYNGRVTLIYNEFNGNRFEVILKERKNN